MENFNEKFEKTLPVIDAEKFIHKFESAVSVFTDSGVKKENIKICVSHAIRAAINICFKDQYSVRGLDSYELSEYDFKWFGFAWPRGNYPYNDKIILFTDDSCMDADPIVEILYEDLI